MSTFLQIAGSPAQGIAVLADDGVVHNLPSTKVGELWTQSVSAGAPGGFANLISATGYTTLARSQSLQYLTVLGKPKAGWKHVHPPIPQGLALTAVTGAPDAGFMLVAGGGRSLHHLAVDDKEWQHLTSPLPFHVAKLAGDIKDTLLLVSDENPSTLAHSGTDNCCWPKLPGHAPIKIEFITGDITHGFVVFGEGQLYTLKLDATDLSKPLDWVPAAHTPDFSFIAMSGNPVDGVAALIRDTSGEGKLVVYATDPSSGPWCLALVPQAEGEIATV